MQHRKTILTPLTDDDTLVELIYSDHEDESQATDRLRFQTTINTREKQTLFGIQWTALQNLGAWLQAETERQRVAANIRR
jgi:hypothetical protein